MLDVYLSDFLVVVVVVVTVLPLRVTVLVTLPGEVDGLLGEDISCTLSRLSLVKEINFKQAKQRHAKFIDSFANF